MRLSFYLPPKSYTTALWNIAGLWHWDVGFECPSQSLLYIIETHQYLCQKKPSQESYSLR